MSLTPQEGPEWVLEQDCLNGCQAAQRVQPTAKTTWPFIRDHALRELKNKPWIQDHLTFVEEIWEDVLRATVVRIREDCLEVNDLQAYLTGAFKHRFIGALMKAQQQRNVLDCDPLPDDVERLNGVVDERWAERLQRDVEAREIVEKLMDPWARKVWILGKFGHSRKIIGRRFGMDELKVKLRYAYAIKKIRAQIERFQNKWKEVGREK